MLAEVIQFNAEVEDLKCSFCKTPKSKVKNMIQAPSGKCICDKCITKCKTLLQSHENKNL